MASPLGWFRRHQKGMMVVFGMVLMAIFGLGSVAMLINNPSQTSDPDGNKVVVKWDGGKLKKSQVRTLRLRHYAAGRFLRALEQAARQARDGKFRSVAIPIQWIPDNMPVRDADFAIAQRYIMAERAKQAGIVVSDTMVNDYISLVHNLVDFSPGDIEQFNRDINGEYMDLVDIRSHLKIELAAQQYRILLNTGLPTSLSPTEAAEYNGRMEKTIECTVLELNVDDYMDKVDELGETPSNSELKKIFEKGRYRLADPSGMEPGFKRPKRVQINYIAADYQKILDNEKRKIKPQQIQEEYAKLVEAEDSLVMELVPEVVPEDPPGNGDGEAPKPPGDDDAPVPPGDDDDAPAPSDEDPADGNTGENGESTENSGEKSGDDSNKESGENTEENKEENGNNEGGDDDLSLNSSPTQFVSAIQDDEQKENAKEESGQESSESEKSEAQDAEANQDPTEDPQPGDNEKAADQEGSDAPKMLDEQEGDEQGSGDQLPGEGDQDNQNPNPILTRPKKLDEALSDLICERMVGETAFREMRRVIVEAQEEVREQQYDYSEWDAQTDAEKKNSEPPITLDLKEMAGRLLVQHGETELLTYSELVENEGFGARQGIVEVASPFGGPPRRQARTMAEIVFSVIDRKTPFEPGDPVVEFATQTNILWWAVEIKDMEILEFAEAKEKVIEFWKREKARELALADAKRIADELNKSGQKLLAYSTSAENTGNFTWYLNGLVKPKGVESPGEDFMDTAFDLEMNECGGALNDSRDYAYVIQKIFVDTRSDAEIAGKLLETWAKFQMVPPNVSGTANREYEYLRSETQRGISKEMNVQWVAE